MKSIRSRTVSLVLLALVLGLAFAAFGCGGFFVSGSVLNNITVAPASVFLVKGDTKQFTANGTTVDGTSKDVTATATWTSSSDSNATVAAGLVKAESAGTATITASQDGVTANGNVIVGASELNSLAISPTVPTVATGSKVQLTATGTLADNTTVNLSSAAAWSSDSTGNATVNSNGVVTGVAAGSAKITANVNTKTSTISATVTVVVQ